tara:strand:+ start:682 stop:1854 length:1173 start_codon:yes stop_codon:yes gene_type:complete
MSKHLLFVLFLYFSTGCEIAITFMEIQQASPNNECNLTFPDENLHNSVCVLFGNEEGCEISCHDERFQSTDEMILDDLEIGDITGIEKFENLVYLDLSGNQIQDISSISALSDLEGLWLEDNQIGDISSISDLLNLRSLKLGLNQIDDISSISDLVNLEYLSLYNNEIQDISPISDLVNLTQVSLANNHEIVDLRPLANIQDINFLAVQGIPARTSYANCQILNSLVDRGTDVAGFDSEECLPESVDVSVSLNPQHFNQQELFNGTNRLISFIVSSLDEDVEILSIQVQVSQPLADLQEVIELWNGEQFVSFSHLRQNQNGIFSSTFFTDDAQLLVSEAGSRLDIRGDVFGVVAGSAVVTCLRSVAYRPLNSGEERILEFNREMCQTLSR